MATKKRGGSRSSASSDAPKGPKNSPEVEQRTLDELIPYARNSRTHSDDQVAEIAASILEFGWTNPVLIRTAEDGGTAGIVAGHARVLAARKLGYTVVPCIRLDHLTETQARAYVIADNRLAEKAGWDFPTLVAEFDDLTAEGFDLDFTGFDQKERDRVYSDLERASDANRREDEDDPTKVPVETNIKPGDIIELGSHRLICGDATDPDVVKALLGDEKPGLMVTDPPYGVGLDANWRDRAGLNQAQRSVIRNDDRADWRAAYLLFTGDVAYVWHSGLHGGLVAEGLKATGFEIRAQIIWCKPRFAISRGHYHWQHEPCWYVVRRGGSGHWSGSRKETTVWEIPNERVLEHGHPNQKPVECMRRPILNNSNPGQLVYDPFGGTGSTLVAAELTGRQARLIELDPLYCQIIVDRYQQLFGDAEPTKAD